MADAPTWVSVVDGLGGALGAVSAAAVAAFALVLQRRTHREELARQGAEAERQRTEARSAQHRERVWDHRVSAYVDLLQALQPSRPATTRQGKAANIYDRAWPLRSRIYAFAARPVVVAFGDFIVMCRAYGERPPSDAEWERWDTLRDRIRVEMRRSIGTDESDGFERAETGSPEQSTALIQSRTEPPMPSSAGPVRNQPPHFPASSAAPPTVHPAASPPLPSAWYGPPPDPPGDDTRH